MSSKQIQLYSRVKYRCPRSIIASASSGCTTGKCVCTFKGAKGVVKKIKRTLKGNLFTVIWKSGVKKELLHETEYFSKQELELIKQ